MRRTGPLNYLDRVFNLNLKDNLIEDFEECENFLRTMNCLQTLDLRGNAICKEVKYRDKVVMLGLQLAELDSKKVMDQERRYLYNLVQQKENAARGIAPPKPQKPVPRKQNTEAVSIGKPYEKKQGINIFGQQASINHQQTGYGGQTTGKNVTINGGADFKGVGMATSNTKFQAKS